MMSKTKRPRNWKTTEFWQDEEGSLHPIDPELEKEAGFPIHGDIPEWVLERRKQPMPKIPAETYRQSIKLKDISGDIYDIENGHLIMYQNTRDGYVPKTLCNFNAWITEDIYKDDGENLERYLRITGNRADGRKLHEIEIIESQFNGMNWVRDNWGVKTHISPGQTIKDHIRYAIEIQSDDAREAVVFTHTGWRDINGTMVYLTADGALGLEGIETDLEKEFRQYRFDAELTGDPVAAFRASMEFLMVAPLNVTLPAWAGMYLAPLSDFIDSAFTIWYVGLSGSFKSTVTALAVSHYGYFDEQSLPVAWVASENTLEKYLFIGKNLPVIIDDWAPGADASKQNELNKKAERIIRSQSNRQGRGRLRADTSFRATFKPRGLLISSGEHLPGGYSASARIFAVPIDGESVDTILLQQQKENRKLYQTAMSGYIRWISSRWDNLSDTLTTNYYEWRDKAHSKDVHPRMPGCIAWLYAGLHTALQYGKEIKAISDKEVETLLSDGWNIFYDLAVDQGGRVDEERPGRKFVEGLQAVLNKGSAVLRNKAEQIPKDPGPGKSAIGWIDYGNGHILLDPTVSYQVVCEFYSRGGGSFNINARAVWDDLKKLNYIEVQGNKTTHTAWISGQNRRILELKKEALGYTSLPEDNVVML